VVIKKPLTSTLFAPIVSGNARQKTEELNFFPEPLGGSGTRSSIPPSFSHRAINRPCDRPLPPTPPLPSRRCGASTPEPLLLRHGTPAPCGSSLRSEPHRRRERTTDHPALKNGAPCSFRFVSVRSSRRSGAPPLRYSRIMPLVFSSWFWS